MNDLKGITVDGKCIEEYLVDHDDDEKKKEALEDFHQTGKDKKGIFYHDPQTKCKSARGSSKGTRVFSRSDINREYWRHNMKSAITKLEKVLALLLMGRWMTTNEMATEMKADDNSLMKSRLNVPSRMVAIHKSPVGALLKRENIAAGKRPIYKWKLVDEACELTLEELYVVYNQKRKEADLDTIIKKHPWIMDYMIERKKDGVEEVEKKRIPIKKKPPEEEVDLADAEEPMPDGTTRLQRHVADLIQQGLSNAFGVNVKVTGEVKILFGLIGKK